MSVILLSNENWGAVLREVERAKALDPTLWPNLTAEEVTARLACSNRAAFTARYHDYDSRYDAYWAGRTFWPNASAAEYPWHSATNPGDALRCVRYNTVEDESRTAEWDAQVDRAIHSLGQREDRWEDTTGHGARLESWEAEG